jgi:hypothetical protein
VVNRRKYSFRVCGTSAPVIGQGALKYNTVPVTIASNMARKFFELSTRWIIRRSKWVALRSLRASLQAGVPQRLPRSSGNSFQATL